MILLTVFASLSVAAAQAQDAPTRMRDCLRNQEYGITAPTPSRHDAKYLYLFNIMKAKPHDRLYGSFDGWTVQGNLKDACDDSLSRAKKDLSNKGWILTGAFVELVPDSIVKQGLAH
jgi:hypothetical protein